MPTTKQSPKDAITEGIQALQTQLESGNSAALTTYLSAMARFHHYSFGNIMLIAKQRPNAVRVAGFNAWKALGRNVTKGEKAIRILAPMVKSASRDTSTGEVSEARVFGFRDVCVFDLSQTEGKALPEFSAMATGECGDAKLKLLAFAESQSIRVDIADDLHGAMGCSYGGRIAILAAQTDAEFVATLIHELAHELMHKGEARQGCTKTQRELEAEAVAFIVGSAIGINMGESSADYIHLYNGSADLLRQSLEAIRTASASILQAIT